MRPTRSRRSATSSTTRRSSNACGRRASRGADRSSEAAEPRVPAGRDHRPRHGAASGAGRREKYGVELIDTTCPLVTKVQRLAQKLVRQGYFLVVYGDSTTPKSRASSAGPAPANRVAAKNIADLPWNAPRGVQGPGQGFAAAQGRRGLPDDEEHRRVHEVRRRSCKRWSCREGGEFRICNTICEPT